MTRPFNAAWLTLLHDLLKYGAHVAPRGQQTLERLGTSISFPASHSLLTVPERNLNYRFAAAEALWMVRGRDDVAPLKRVNSKMLAFSDDGLTLAGAYGPRIAQQLPAQLEKLRQDPSTRQAVVDIWQKDLTGTKDTPCTLSFQFLNRPAPEGELHLIATMRSNDVWLGTPYDAFSFATVLQFAAGTLGLIPGRVTIQAGSCHLYAQDAVAARRIVDAYYDGVGTAEPVLLDLESLGDPTARYFALCADSALDGDYVMTPSAAAQVPGWDKLFRAVTSAGSDRALEVLRG